MKRHDALIVALLAFFIGSFTPLASSAGKLTKEEVRSLITGNTIEEVFTEKPWQNKLYFTADGKFKRIDQNNNPDSGKWDFDPDGSLCLERKKRKCWFLQTAEEGTYHVISRTRGQHVKTWRVVKGNPYKL
ncbi:MAG: hypothetical protein OEU74_04430 [Gammaproteobacteria bacterium]|nr:hypothetical protein [Gammaproteobacteria bacterium]